MKSAQRTRRPLALAVAALVGLPLALSACGTTAASSTEAVTEISVMDYYNNEPDKSFIGDALTKCGTQLGVTIKRETVPGKSLISKVLQQSSSKTLPDVLMLDNPDLQQIAATGALAPLSDFKVSTENFAEGVLSAGTYKDKVYGLAPTVNTIALFYNKDILDKAGVTPPTTWDELKAAAAKLTAGDQYGLAFNANPTYEGTWQFLPVMWSNGGDEKKIDTTETEEALQLWTDLVKSGSVSSSALNWTQADVKDQFLAGKAAMMVNGPWQIPALDKQPTLQYGVVKIPVREAGQTAVAPLGGEVWTVPQTGNKARQAKAAELVACLNSDENQLAMATARNTIPSKTTLSDKFAADNPKLATFTELIKTARARTGQLGEEWPAQATKIYTAIQTALTGNASPAEALKQAQGQ
ncbi:multiple sugar transport system substrate-binding protein [Paenarthrobacter nitroguajacolicus]|uniref:sugar ABC transporter substrate-binding protein n=1 Tax=Paenarthrobacter TaxID=1742992 RepID=UPI00285B6DF5|nr:extracellular solute-binding protein [Paenarthrobacter nitroguajacolicus]MDR6988014.1 multiple sugar transport system substrate-binding protein [Paenarthrobacter nitroguajacolicus]